MKTTMNTGALELRGLYQRYVTEGLLLAGLLHLTMIGGYQVYTNLTGDFTEFPRRFRSVAVSFLPPPPSPTNRPVLPSPMLSGIDKPSIGSPVPVPDPEINREITIATQQQMNDVLDAALANNSNSVTEYIIDGTVIENEEIPPDFRPVEIQPSIVHSVHPLYPDVARRAGIEGIVYIKMWVTKEGKVKKAEIVKSNNDLFNQAAIDAAMQWTFTPAIMNNGPVSVWVTVPFKFKLNSRN